VLDGDAFGRPACLRIGFGLASEDFASGLAVLGEALHAHAERRAIAPPACDVIVLAKAPIAGYAKTRLAASIGGEAAARMSAAFLDDTLAFAAGRARRLYIACAPSPAPFHALAPAARCFTQPDGDLGARLAHAFETAFRDGAERPVLIGADSPTLPAHLLAVADHALETHDVVLGPAEDGGYYLAGMRRPHTSIFREIDWSTDRVLAQTIARARDAGLRVFFLPYWYDIDDARSLDRLSHDAGMRRATRDALKAPALVGAAS
jgi:rSAM/selenodomain-associated transferase 1